MKTIEKDKDLNTGDMGRQTSDESQVTTASHSLSRPTISKVGMWCAIGSHEHDNGRQGMDSRISGGAQVVAATEAPPDH